MPFEKINFFCPLIYYLFAEFKSKKISKSLSNSAIPPIPKFLTKTLAKFKDENAGSVGSKTPKLSSQQYDYGR